MSQKIEKMADRLGEIALRLPDPTIIKKGELQKSSRTRKRILDAAIECLADVGYSGTNTSAVASRAGLTRPAMLYHFASRASLIEAVVYHIMRIRLELFLRDVRTIQQQDEMVEIAWRHLHTSVFRAFTELMVVAHSDEDLARIFGPALAEYDRARRDVSMATAPKEEIEAPWFNLRRDVFRFLLEGFAMQGGLSYDAERRRSAILAFAKILFYTDDGIAVFKAAQDTLGRRPKGRQRVASSVK
ncbi:MAG: DNA-binding transcriptional regulator, AcrR family [Caulobacteraceae bacterium]|nr:DNA-binding transcriptional regulator, AcrR family [Caulobacteraceae bacterium]